MIDKVMEMIKLAYNEGVNNGRDTGMEGLDRLALFEQSKAKEAIDHMEKRAVAAFKGVKYD